MATYDSGVVKYTLEINALSVSEFNTNQSLSIFPNPTRDIINIQVKNGLIIKSVEMYNIAGQKIMDTGFSKEINMSSLQDGVYLLRLEDGNGDVYIKRIIKK